MIPYNVLRPGFSFTNLVWLILSHRYVNTLIVPVGYKSSMPSMQRWFNQTAVEVGACVINYTKLFYVDVIPYLCPKPDAGLANPDEWRRSMWLHFISRWHRVKHTCDTLRAVIWHSSDGYGPEWKYISLNGDFGNYIYINIYIYWLRNSIFIYLFLINGIGEHWY